MIDNLDKIRQAAQGHPAIQDIEIVYRPSTSEYVAYVAPRIQYYIERFDLKQTTLPNNKKMFYLSEGEVEYFYTDIFVNNSYLKDFLNLEEGDVIFDVGANVGYFSLFVSSHLKNYKLFAFEPAPPTYKILLLNAFVNSINAKVFDLGLSDKKGSRQFTYYPNSSGFSTFKENQLEEKELLREVMSKDLKKSIQDDESLDYYLDVLTRDRFEKEQYVCRLSTISDVIVEQNVGVIDLLKVDVEKSELDILKGIKHEHWMRIKQIVVEVHDFDHELDAIKKLLEDHEFDIVIEQEDRYSNTVMNTIYGKRRNFKKEQYSNSSSDQRQSASSNWPAAFDLSTDLKKYLRKTLPEELVPQSIIVTNSLVDLQTT